MSEAPERIWVDPHPEVEWGAHTSYSAWLVPSKTVESAEYTRTDLAQAQIGAALERVKREAWNGGLGEDFVAFTLAKTIFNETEGEWEPSIAQSYRILSALRKPEPEGGEG